MEYVLQIHFSASNNFAEYEALVHGLKMAKDIGIRLISTLRHLEILPETFGVELPEELVREAKAHPDDVREVGTEWAIAQSRELMAAGVPVLHYYTMSRTTNIQKIVKTIF